MNNRNNDAGDNDNCDHNRGCEQLKEQQQIQTKQTTSKPQLKQKPGDGPATKFEADPMVSDIPMCQDGDYFGLVLVTNWPPSPLADVDCHYQKFLGAVKSCFKSEDTTIAISSTGTTCSAKERQQQQQCQVPVVYFQPILAVHVTLATFARIHKIVDNDDDKAANDRRRECEKKRATELVRSASRLPEWPKDPIRLVVDSAQIGTRAGILLWRDLSGGVEAIRRCLRQAAAAEAASLLSSGSRGDSDPDRHQYQHQHQHKENYPRIPGIIHSTILRFSSVPKTPGDKVQEKFRSEVLAKIGKNIFPSSNNDDDDVNESGGVVIVANTVKLACESNPYMHFPADENHVLWSCELQQQQR